MLAILQNSVATDRHDNLAGVIHKPGPTCVTLILSQFCPKKDISAVRGMLFPAITWSLLVLDSIAWSTCSHIVGFLATARDVSNSRKFFILLFLMICRDGSANVFLVFLWLGNLGLSITGQRRK
jgi:hypothetical protein